MLPYPCFQYECNRISSQPTISYCSQTHDICTCTSKYNNFTKYEIIQKKVLPSIVPIFVCIHVCTYTLDQRIIMTTCIPHVQRTCPQESFHQGLCRLLQTETYNPVRKPNIQNSFTALVLTNKCDILTQMYPVTFQIPDLQKL